MNKEYNQSWIEKKKKFYNSPEWRVLRLEILKRDQNICQKCGKLIFKSPNVHHIKYLTPQNIDDINVSLNPENLMTVCEDCHNKIHEKGFKKKESIVNEDLTIDYSKR